MIKTSRLILEKARPEDINYIMELERDKENNKFIWSGSYEDHLKELTSENYLLLIIKNREDLENIGFVLNYIDQKNRKFEFRRFAVEKKGLGYGRESMEAVINYVFEETETNKFFLDVYPDNKIGIKLYESLNMKKEAVLRQNHWDKNIYRDQIIYSILRSEYEKRRA